MRETLQPGNPGQAILVRQSRLGNPGEAIQVRQSRSGNPGQAIQVRQCMLGIAGRKIVLEIAGRNSRPGVAGQGLGVRDYSLTGG